MYGAEGLLWTGHKCRPISLTTILRRIYEKVLHPVLTGSTVDRMHPAQAGFMQSDSTLRPLQLADHSQRPYRILYDAMFAFDSPLFHILAAELADMDVPRSLRRSIHYLFFCSLTSTLIANGRKSWMIGRRRGLFQGTVLAPPPFNVYLNRLLCRFSQGFGSHMSLLLVIILAYADDIKIFATSYDEACRMTRFILQACSLLGLRIRASKCAVLSHNMRDIRLEIDFGDHSILAKANEK